MYESTKEQIKYERRNRHESFFVDTHKKEPVDAQIDDGWLRPIPWKESLNCDVWVLHSCIPNELLEQKKNRAMIAVLHGPNEHMLLKEFVSNRKEEAFNLHINILWKYDATVVINMHEYDILKLYDEHDRLHYIPNSIVLERLEDVFPWKFEEHPAILSCDVLRLEKLPGNIIWAMPKIVEKVPNARLNLFNLELEAIATWRNIFCRSKARYLEHLCETIQLENGSLYGFMKGADIGFNNNLSGIASRVTMEMQALGVPVISYGGIYTPYVAKIWDLDSIAEQVKKCWNDLSDSSKTIKEDTKKYAREHYDRAKEVKKFIALYTEVLGTK